MEKRTKLPHGDIAAAFRNQHIDGYIYRRNADDGAQPIIICSRKSICFVMVFAWSIISLLLPS